MKKKLLAGMAVGLIVFGMIGVASAEDFDFVGTFDYHNDVLLINFTTTETSTVTLFSSSWLDGNQGFDPMLGLWDDTGALIEFQDDGHNIGSTLSNSVLYDHGNWDSYYDASVDAGSYTVSLTTYPNWNIGDSLSLGFDYDSDTPIPIASWDQPANGFQTGDYAFHVINASTAEIPGTPDPPNPVPEPATMLLFGTGLVGLIGSRLRRKKK